MNVLTVVLHYQITRAEVKKASKQILRCEQVLHHIDQLCLPFLGVDKILVLADYAKSLRELLLSVLLNHMLRELSEVACVQIDHVFILRVRLVNVLLVRLRGLSRFRGGRGL